MRIDPEREAVIFDIQGFSVHDGPGGRTLVFFKGCPLRCYWCCNPESQRMAPELMYRRSNCVGCWGCVARRICPQDAIRPGERPGDYVRLDREACGRCEDIPCAEECFHDALKVAGSVCTLDELMARIERESRFWGPGGGVTVGGGEMAVQWRFVSKLLRRCHESYVNTAVESCSYAPWEHLAPIYENVDFAFTDVKHMDSERHRDATGVGNELILENVAKVAQLGREGRLRHVVRIPVIEGFNDDDKNIRDTAAYVRGIGTEEVNVLPFHRMGASKYEQLDRAYDCRDMQACSQQTLARVSRIVEKAGLTCYVGSETPF